VDQKRPIEKKKLSFIARHIAFLLKPKELVVRWELKKKKIRRVRFKYYMAFQRLKIALG
jgi:hypothetical protein